MRKLYHREICYNGDSVGTQTEAHPDDVKIAKLEAIIARSDQNARHERELAEQRILILKHDAVRLREEINEVTAENNDFWRSRCQTETISELMAENTDLKAKLKDAVSKLTPGNISCHQCETTVREIEDLKVTCKEAKAEAAEYSSENAWFRDQRHGFRIREAILRRKYRIVEHERDVALRKVMNLEIELHHEIDELNRRISETAEKYFC